MAQIKEYRQQQPAVVDTVYCLQVVTCDNTSYLPTTFNYNYLLTKTDPHNINEISAILCTLPLKLGTY